MSEEKPTCVWNYEGLPCDDGEVTVETIFDGKLKVPMCKGCYNHHNKIIYLCDEQKIDIEVLMFASASAREEFYKAFKHVNSDEFKKSEKKREVEKMKGKKE